MYFQQKHKCKTNKTAKCNSESATWLVSVIQRIKTRTNTKQNTIYQISNAPNVAELVKLVTRIFCNKKVGNANKSRTLLLYLITYDMISLSRWRCKPKIAVCFPNCTRHPCLDVRDTRISMVSASDGWIWPTDRVWVLNNMRCWIRYQSLSAVSFIFGWGYDHAVLNNM